MTLIIAWFMVGLIGNIDVVWMGMFYKYPIGEMDTGIQYGNIVLYDLVWDCSRMNDE